MKVKNAGSRFMVRALRDFVFGDRVIKRGDTFTVTKWQAVSLARQGKTESAAEDETAPGKVALGKPAPKKRRAGGAPQGRRSTEPGSSSAAEV